MPPRGCLRADPDFSRGGAGVSKWVRGARSGRLRVRGDIVCVDLAFHDLADVQEVNALYAELFPEGCRPARTIYQAARLPYGGKVKVQAVAARATGAS